MICKDVGSNMNNPYTICEYKLFCHGVA